MIKIKKLSLIIIFWLMFLSAFSLSAEVYYGEKIKITFSEKAVNNERSATTFNNWEVDCIYNFMDKTFKLPSEMIFPDNLHLLAVNSVRYADISINEVESFSINDGKINGIKLKDGISADIDKINISHNRKNIPEKSWIEEINRLIYARISLSITNLSSIIPVNKLNKIESDSFIKIYGNLKDLDYAYSITETENGDFIAAGKTYIKNSGEGFAWVIKLNSQGSIIWRKQIWKKFDSEAKYVTETDDNNYLIAGTILNRAENKKYFFLITLDENGEELRRILLKQTIFEEINSARVTSDNCYIISGFSYTKTDLKRKLIVNKVDINGNILWEYLLKGNDGEGHSVIETDKGFIMAGTIFNENSGFDMLLVNLDMQGNVIWKKTYGGTQNDMAFSIETTEKNDFIISGMTYSYSNGRNDIWILNIDKDGEIIWEKRIGSNNYEGAYCVNPTSDSGYILTGYRHSGNSSGSEILFIKLNKNGETLWKKSLPGKKHDRAYFIKENSDGSFIATGYITRNKKNTDIFIIKLDRNGNFPDQITE